MPSTVDTPPLSKNDYQQLVNERHSSISLIKPTNARSNLWL